MYGPTPSHSPRPSAIAPMGSHDQRQLGEWHAFHFWHKSIPVLSGIDHVEFVQLEISERHVHALGHSRGILALDLDADPFPFVEKEQVQFRSGMYPIEVGIGLAE